MGPNISVDIIDLGELVVLRNSYLRLRTLTDVFCIIIILLLATLLNNSSVSGLVVVLVVEEIGTRCNWVWSTYLTRIHRALGTSSTLLCLLTYLSLKAQTIAESIHLVGVLAGVFRLTF